MSLAATAGYGPVQLPFTSLPISQMLTRAPSACRYDSARAWNPATVMAFSSEESSNSPMTAPTRLMRRTAVA